jgi:hypothetical protein
MKNQVIAPNFQPLGLSRNESAVHLGVGTTLFDEMVEDGRMPPPKCINSRRIWSRIEIEKKFAELPDGGPAHADNPWDEV